MNKTVGAVISALVIIFCIVIALFCTVAFLLAMSASFIT